MSFIFCFNFGEVEVEDNNYMVCLLGLEKVVVVGMYLLLKV